MLKIKVIIITFILYANVAQSQITDWFWLNPYPQGNDLYGCAIVDSNSIYVVGALGSVLFTKNGGKSWQYGLDSSGNTRTLRSIAFQDSVTGIAVGDGGIILRTTDEGYTWSKANTPYNQNFKYIKYMGGDSLIILGDTALITTDAGNNWSGLDWPKGHQLITIDGFTEFIIGDGIYRTTDRGNSWYKMNDKICSAMCFTDSNTGYIASSIYGQGIIEKTTDHGESWYEVLYKPGSEIRSVASDDSGRVYAVGKQLVDYDTWGDIYTTIDSGESWLRKWRSYNKYLNNVTTNKYISVAVGCSGTIVKYQGGAWEELSKGIIFPFFWVSFGDPYVGYILGYWPGNWLPMLKTIDGGIQWVKINFDYAYTPYYEGKFCNSQNGGLFNIFGSLIKTIDGGRSWNEVDNSNGIDFHLNNKNRLWVVGDGIRFTTNDGASWIVQDPGEYSAIFFVDSTSGVAVGSKSLIKLTTNGGKTWFDRSDTSGVNLTYVKMFDENKIITVGDSGTILRTTDAGMHWERINSSHTKIKFVDLNTGASLGDRNTVFFTRDGGVSWDSTMVPTSNHITDFDLVSNPAIGSMIAQRQSEVKSVSKHPKTYFNATTDPTIYVVGWGGAILVAGLSPLHGRTWNGSVSTSWFTDSNWTPTGIPIPGDSIIIPDVINDPIIDRAQRQIIISSLVIHSGGKLTITDSLSQFNVMSDVRIEGTLKVAPQARTIIVTGGSWIANSDSDSGFIPAKSTVFLTGSGTFEKNFYNLVLDTTSSMKSNNNIVVEKQIWVLNDVTIREQDTLIIADSSSQAIMGVNKIIGGTIKRSVQQGVTDPYRYESDSTYVKFLNGGVQPSAIEMTTYPNSIFPTYPIHSGWNMVSVPHQITDMSKTNLFSNAISDMYRYDQILGYVAIDTLRNRDGYWVRYDKEDTVSTYEMVPSRVDTVSNTVTGDSLNKFSRWTLRVPRPGGGTTTTVRRVYSILPVPSYGLSYEFNLALHYEQSEVPVGLPEDSLRLARYEERLIDTIGVVPGWNLIGSLSNPVCVASILSEPEGIIQSNFFSYNGSYYAVDSLEPMHSYWVKVDTIGMLILKSSICVASGKKNAIQELGRLEIRDGVRDIQDLYITERGTAQDMKMYELPPVPPEGAFDARFRSGRSVEMYGVGEKKEYPIQIQSEKYPLMVRWISSAGLSDVRLEVNGKEKKIIDEGELKIDGAPRSLVLKIMDKEELPKEYGLDQAYPNPFNPSTTIRYQLPGESKVRLQIYNVLGQVIATLKDGVESAGFKSNVWIASGLSSGIYYYRLDAVSINDPTKSFTQVKKMILLR